jgi:hypothetical protein
MQTTQVTHCADFQLDGTGQAAAWAAATWLELPACDGQPGDRTRAKLLWSDTGLYVLCEAEDRRLTCTMTEDLLDLFKEDVFECFFWPDESQFAYFEYEISPLGKHLPIMVNNDGEGSFHGWLPWKEEGRRAIRRAVTVRGGEQRSGAAISGWTAEAFIPFKLLTGLRRRQPKAGMIWRANLYRIDYDHGPGRHYAWSPVTDNLFHNYWEFGRITFVA